MIKKTLFTLLTALIFNNIYSQKIMTSYFSGNSSFYLLSNAHNAKNYESYKKYCDSYENLMSDSAIYSVCIYYCDLDRKVFLDFQKDISTYFHPIEYNFYFFKEKNNVLILYNYQLFSCNFLLTCGNNDSEEVRLIDTIKNVVERRKWDFEKVTIYSTGSTDRRIEYLAEYEGISYMIKNDDLFPVVDYIKQNYTIDQLNKTFEIRVK